MKNFFFYLAFLTVLINLSSFSYGQDIPQLKITRTGVEPIVIEVKNMTAIQLYQKSLDWVKETYENPDKVLKAKIENDKIRISAFAQDAWWYKAMGIRTSYGMDYSIEISFKEGKYRFEYVVGQFYTRDYTKALFGYSAFFKNTGEVRKAYEDAVPSIEETMNNLSKQFYSYVTGEIDKSDDNW